MMTASDWFAYLEYNRYQLTQEVFVSLFVNMLWLVKFLLLKLTSIGE